MRPFKGEVLEVTKPPSFVLSYSTISITTAQARLLPDSSHSRDVNPAGRLVGSCCCRVWDLEKSSFNSHNILRSFVDSIAYVKLVANAVISKVANEGKRLLATDRWDPHACISSSDNHHQDKHTRVSVSSMKTAQIVIFLFIQIQPFNESRTHAYLSVLACLLLGTWLVGS